jgi:hypothetical protein
VILDREAIDPLEVIIGPNERGTPVARDAGHE